MLTAIILLTFAVPEVDAPAFFAGNDELRAYLLEAAEKNPGLQASYREWEAAMERIPQVTSLEDPMFGYTQFVRSQDKRFMVSLEQKFPWFGTLRLKGDKAAAEADAALARFYAVRNQLFAELKRAYFEYAQLAEDIRITESQAKLLTQMEDLVRSRYALGMAKEQDLYRVEIEQTKLQDQYTGLMQSKPALAAKLNEALGRKSEEELPFPQSVDFAPSPPPAPIVLARIRAANPDLAAMKHMMESWHIQQEVARKAGYPELSLGVEYGDMKLKYRNRRRQQIVSAADAAKMLVNDVPTMGEGAVAANILYDNWKMLFPEESQVIKDDFSVSLKMSLPIWRTRVRAGVREAKLMEQAADDNRNRAAFSMESAARSALFGYADASRRHTLYKDTLTPKAQQTYDSLQATYGAGTGSDFLDLLDSVRMMLEFQREQARAARDLYVAAAELEMLMGGPWTSQESVSYDPQK